MDDTTASAPAPAAPAPTSTPSTTSTPSADRPTSFADSFAREMTTDPAPVTPGDPPPAVTPPVAATAPLTAETTPVPAVPTPETKGPIPFERHEAALKNARVKAGQEAVQQFQQQYAPHVELGQKIQADAVGTVTQLVSELANHPDFGPQMISALARTLGARRNQAAPIETDQDAEPQADYQNSEGTPFMSAPQQAKWAEWNRRQMLREVDSRLQPLQQREQQAQARERLEGATKDAHDRMSKVLAPYASQPEFTANKPAIIAKVSELLQEGHDPATALGVAYSLVLRDTVMPSRTAQSQQSLVAQAVAKATGSTTAPGATPAAAATRPTSFEEGFRGLAM